MTTATELKSLLIAHSLFPKTDLSAAIDQLGFVQADPIRAPARCQDLILRHRVTGYKAGDLEKAYPSLDLEEDYTFAYGFLPKTNHALLHPRTKYKLSPLEKKVVQTVRRLGPTHPSDLIEHFGNETVKNAWGGNSKATKHALEKAHHHGHLRVARRENGIRVYEIAQKRPKPLTPEERFDRLVLLTANLFGPTSERFLLSQVSQYRHLVATPAQRKKVLKRLVEAGQLDVQRIDDTNYVIPGRPAFDNTAREDAKILAPFDPVVRDRNRFEHLWKWTYRFEAYTPAAKRVRGYYAMPILWETDVIGWANAKVIENKLNVEIGYSCKPSNKRRFRTALKKEVVALSQFLRLEEKAPTITEL